MHMKKPMSSQPQIAPEALKALADPTRMKIMLMLEGRRRTVNEIVEFFELSQPTISRHLQTLADADLVKREKSGQKVYYSLNGDTLGAVCVGLAAAFPCCVTITPNTETSSIPNETKRKKGGLR